MPPPPVPTPPAPSPEKEEGSLWGGMTRASERMSTMKWT